MKKPLPISTFTKLTVLFLAITLGFIINSCRKDAKNLAANVTDPEVLQAKTWYETTYPINAASGSSNGKLITQDASTASPTDYSQIIKPDWPNFAKYTRFNKKVIEIPLDPENKLLSALKSKTTGKLYAQKEYSKSSFLILTDGKTYSAYIMTIVADSAYLKGDITKLARNTYSKRDTDFTGYVLYYTPKGVYVRGYAYKNGQLVTPTLPSQNSQQVQSAGKLKTATVTFVTICIDWYQVNYINGVEVNEFYLYTTCSTTSSDDGGGGGSSNPPPPPCPTTGGSSGGVPNSQEGQTVTINVAGPTVPDPGNDGGGGDGSGFPPPDQPGPCGVSAPPTVTTGGGGGTNTTPTSPPLIDSINIKFQCAKLILAQLPTLKNSITNLINATFNTTTPYNVIFHDGDSTSFAANPLEDGYTTMQNSTDQNIYINPFVLNNASNEYILVTFYHEALHAFLNTEYTTLGAVGFQAKYPEMLITTSWHFGGSGQIIDDFYIDEGIASTQIVDSDPQHRTMAAYFTDCLIAAILSYNPQFDANRARDLARGGIFKDSSIYYGNISERDRRTGNSLGTTCNIQQP